MHSVSWAKYKAPILKCDDVGNVIPYYLSSFATSTSAATCSCPCLDPYPPHLSMHTIYDRADICIQRLHLHVHFLSQSGSRTLMLAAYRPTGLATRNQFIRILSLDQRVTHPSTVVSLHSRVNPTPYATTPAPSSTFMRSHQEVCLLPSPCCRCYAHEKFQGRVIGEKNEYLSPLSDKELRRIPDIMQTAYSIPYTHDITQSDALLA